MVAIAAYGLEAGAWLKVAVTEDVDGVAKAGQQHHPAAYEARYVVWVATRLEAELVRDTLLGRAGADGLLLTGSCLAMTVAGYALALATAAHVAGVALTAHADWERLAEMEARR